MTSPEVTASAGGKSIEEEKDGPRKVMIEIQGSSEHRKVVVVKEQMMKRVAVVAQMKEESKGPDLSKIPLFIGIIIKNEAKVNDIIRDSLAKIAASVGSTDPEVSKL
jgi:hypothetical protein